MEDQSQKLVQKTKYQKVTNEQRAAVINSIISNPFAKYTTVSKQLGINYENVRKIHRVYKAENRHSKIIKKRQNKAHQKSAQTENNADEKVKSTVILNIEPRNAIEESYCSSEISESSSKLQNNRNIKIMEQRNKMKNN